jgi:long-chain acyl-CoA synthetase
VARRGSGVPFLCYEPRHHHVADLLTDGLRRADRDHLVQGGRRLSFGHVVAAARAVAGHLRARGLRPGDRLLLLGANSPEWVVVFWATIEAGGIATVGNGGWSADEVQHAVGRTAPRLTFADERGAGRLPAHAADTVVTVEEIRTVVDGATPADPLVRPADHHEDLPAAIVFTAGTTGAPKAVTLPHRSLIANLHNLLVMSRRLPHRMDPDRPQSVSLQSGPLFHVGGVQAILLAMVGGNRLVFLRDRFDATEVLDVIERERVTWWGPIPTMASRVLDDPTLPGRDVSSVRSISMGGAPVQPALVARLREAFPNARKGMSTIYGMTETGGTVAAANGRTMAEHPTTSGAPMPTVELRIDGPGPDGEGEIVVRTPGQMLGYWGDDADGLLDEEGFVHTGDRGKVVDGLLYVTGRSKDLIIRGGENIAPAHVESVLLRHPAVGGCAVVGLPHADLGEEVGAVVRVRADAAVTERELADFAGQHLGRYQVPSRWWLRTDDIPTTDAGKLDKRSLREAWLRREPAGAR